MYTAVKDISRVKEILKVIEPLDCLTEEVIIGKIAESGALLQGHWKLLSGKHSNIFLKFRMIAEKCNNGFLGGIAKELVSRFRGAKIDAVLGPETAGALLVDKVSAGLNVRPALAKVDADGRPCEELLLNSEVKKGESVLIINDLATTGKSIDNLIALVESKKAKIAGIGLFAARDAATIDRLRSKVDNIYLLVKMDTQRFESPCELCLQKVPLDNAVDHN